MSGYRSVGVSEKGKDGRWSIGVMKDCDSRVIEPDGGMQEPPAGLF